MGAARGGPTFPGIFLGLVGGLLCAHLPGLAETPAVGALVAAAVVSSLGPDASPAPTKKPASRRAARVAVAVLYV